MNPIRLSIGLVAALSVVAGCDSSSPADGTPAPAGPNVISRSGGDQQIGHTGLPLSSPVSVRVVTSSGRPVSDVPVTFFVSSGGGWVSGRQPIITDGNGEASIQWYMGLNTSGTHLLMATSPAGSVTFRANMIEHEPLVYSGPDGFVELRVGTLPLILSAGRGGSLRPGDIPERSGAGEAHTGTVELVEEILNVFQERSRGTPTVLISRLHRSRLDPDVELAVAAAPDSRAELAWREYHSFLGGVRSHLVRRYGAGLFIDFHGRDDTGGPVALGYLLSAADLALDDVALDQSGYAQRSSLHAVATGSFKSFSEVLRGPQSLGSLLQARTAAAVPSQAVRTPGPGYVEGGLSTRRYGSHDGVPVSAVHMRLPLEGYRDTPANRRAFAEKFVDGLDEYFSAHFKAGLNAALWR
jgi:hypothetical protein